MGAPHTESENVRRPLTQGRPMAPLELAQRLELENHPQQAAEFALADGAAHFLIRAKGRPAVHTEELVILLLSEVTQLELETVRWLPSARGIDEPVHGLGADEIGQ